MLGLALLAAIAAPPTGDNVLVVVLDDVGIDRLGVYGAHPSPAPSPTIDALAAAGVTFLQARAQAVCSPTRACILTGQQSFRTGIGNGIPWAAEAGDPFNLDLGPLTTLPEAASRVARTAAFGKWHLSTLNGGAGWLHPLVFGFGSFAGSKQNLGGAMAPPSAYFEWEKNTAAAGRASQEIVEGYATSIVTDDALRWILQLGDAPWLCWLAYHAAHQPLHAPPADLQPVSLAGETSPAADQHRAMVEALDHELGRLLDRLPAATLARTWVIVVGDNGDPPEAVEPPWPSSTLKSKPRLYEPNIRVPLIVAGAAIDQPGRTSNALVHVVDLFATICTLLGVPTPTSGCDSIDFSELLLDATAVGSRVFSYSERWEPNGYGPFTLYQFAVTDGRWKVGKFGGGGSTTPGFAALNFYDLEADPDEEHDLLELPDLTPEQHDALDALLGHRDALLASACGN